jgi:hypothetical protein
VSVFQFQDREQILAGLPRQPGVRCGGVQGNGLAEAVEICTAIRAVLKVPLQGQALGRCELCIEFLTNVAEDVVAMNVLIFHAVM